MVVTVVPDFLCLGFVIVIACKQTAGSTVFNVNNDFTVFTDRNFVTVVINKLNVVNRRNFDESVIVEHAVLEELAGREENKGKNGYES